MKAGCTQRIESDLTDAASSERLLTLGRDLWAELNGLMVHVEKVRQQQLMLLANLQLAGEGGDDQDVVLQICKGVLQNVAVALPALRLVFSGEQRSALAKGTINKPFETTARLPFDDQNLGKHIGVIRAEHVYGTAMLAEQGDEMADLSWPVSLSVAKGSGRLLVARVPRTAWKKEQRQGTIDFLRSIKMPLADLELRKLATQLKLKELAPGSILMREGEKASSLFLVKAGELRILAAIDGPESALGGRRALKEIAEVGQGDFLDEIKWDEKQEDWVYGTTVKAFGTGVQVSWRTCHISTLRAAVAGVCITADQYNTAAGLYCTHRSLLADA